MSQWGVSLKRFRSAFDRFMMTTGLAFSSDSASRWNGWKLRCGGSCRRGRSCTGYSRRSGAARRQTRQRIRRTGRTLLRRGREQRTRLARAERHHRQRHTQSKERDPEPDGGSSKRARSTAWGEQTTEARTTATHAEGSAFGALQQHDEDQANRDEEMNDSEYRLHRLPVPVPGTEGISMCRSPASIDEIGNAENRNCTTDPLRGGFRARST
jgi:hypothetical protein